MIKMIQSEEFETRIEIHASKFNDSDFDKFWNWKLKIENETTHILDHAHRDETHRQLCGMIRTWQAYRGRYPIKGWEERLGVSLKRMSDAYHQIRRYSLLEFNKVPKEDLELIWHELGCVKEENGNRNEGGNYYTVAITKPLMFLWGQTLAFDSNVRESMPFSNIPKIELKANKWNFNTWHKAVDDSSDFLRKNSAIIEISKNISIKKYGTDSIVPYGRFLDIYYWIGGTPYEKICQYLQEIKRR